MKKNFITAAAILFVTMSVVGCGTPRKGGPASPTIDTVGTIVEETMQAFRSATPIATDTALPTDTSTPTVTVPVPAGWVEYRNGEYGFAFSHPNLYDCEDQCGVSDYSSNDLIFLTTFVIESSVHWGTDTPFDGFSIDVDPNNEGLSFVDFIERAHKGMESPRFDGDEVVSITASDVSYGGQKGTLFSKARYAEGLVFLPFPNSKAVLIFTVSEAQPGSFMETANQVLETLVFTK